MIGKQPDQAPTRIGAQPDQASTAIGVVYDKSQSMIGINVETKLFGWLVTVAG